MYLEYLWNHWLIVAFLSPFFWALSNITDIYFVTGVYEDEWDGVFINAFFQLMPWLLPLFGLVAFHFSGFWVTVLALLAGGFLMLSYFFYFKTLFISNDMVILEALWNISIPLVPFLAWLFLGERLTLINYLGMLLAFAGAIIFALHKKIRSKRLKDVFITMMGGVLFLSLSMIFQTKVYQVLDGDFWIGFLLFSAGASLTGFLFTFFDSKTIRARVQHLFRMSKDYFAFFLLAESLNLLGVVTLQRAVDISPSVSFVTAIGSLAPVFVLVLSFLLVLVMVFLNQGKARKMYQDQLVGFKTKIFACCIIAVGVYLIS